MVGAWKKVGTEVFGWERKKMGVAVQEREWLGVGLQTSLWRARWRELGCRGSRRERGKESIWTGESKGQSGEQVAIIERPAQVTGGGAATATGEG